MTNSFKDIIKQLQQQRVAIDRAIAALQEVGDSSVEQGVSTATAAAAKRNRPRKAVKKKAGLSAEARERIAAAQRKRWAAQKKSAGVKPAAKKATKKAL